MPETFGICRLPPGPIPAWATEARYHFVGRTPDELSVVCPEAAIPASVRADMGWRCLKVRGPLDLSLTGVLASLAGPLSEAGLSLFALSTYDTDYLLVKDVRQATQVLHRSGHRVTG